MAQFDCVYINGDSYSAPDRGKCYGHFVSEILNVPVENHAVPGNNNQAITRTTIEHVNQLKSQYQRPLILIAWSYVHRQEVWYSGRNPAVLDKLSGNNRLITLDWLLNLDPDPEYKALIIADQTAKQLTDFYTNLYLLSSYLESKNIEYRFFSGANNRSCAVDRYPHVFGLHQCQWVSSNPKIYQLHDFSIAHWARNNDPDRRPETNHLSVPGHGRFAQFLLDNIVDSSKIDT